MNTTKEMFDKVAEDYELIMQENLGKGQDVKYYAEYKIKLAKKKIQSQPEAILEFGCGTGRNTPYIEQYFKGSKIWGCDISGKSLEIAVARNPNATFMSVTETLKSGLKFDLILVPNVFHHIDPVERDDAMKDIKAMLTPSGSVLIIENNPYNPITVKMVKTCPFDEGVILLKKNEVVARALRYGLKVPDSGYCMFVPSNIKQLAFIEPLFKLLPIGAQYYVIAKNI